MPWPTPTPKSSLSKIRAAPLGLEGTLGGQGYKHAAATPLQSAREEAAFTRLRSVPVHQPREGRPHVHPRLVEH